ncbi:helix-turn-helix transcriptional regulator [Sphingopyxis sp. XHP0097]|uniref:Helix-turn-helix transcriptional regulator n=1 Tax=Sphingopyxis jiangsuensis TaxID=2871171 RepID=A0ABS7MDH4_9SPHN|nr:MULTISPECIES: helix-turn-helix transcriptional regulator [Sphingopyxis]MBY4637070.1 helix-turn-helix transcriptional regulator [Sphingopyxis jiangsuensis]
MGRRAEPDWDEIFMQAALQPETWLDALDALARHTGSSHGQLIGVGGAREIPFNLVTNFAPGLVEHFAEQGWGAETQNFRVAASNRHVERGYYDPVLHEDHYDAVMPGLASLEYVEWCEEIGIPFGCQTNLVIDKFGVIGLATLRNRKDGRTTADQRRRFASGATAARRAVRLQEKIEGEQAKLMAGAFDAINVSAFIVDARGHLLAHTSGAESLLKSGDVRLAGASIDAAGAPLTLGQAVQALIVDDGFDHVRTSLPVRRNRPAVIIEGFRLPRRDWSLGKLPHAILVASGPKRDRSGVALYLSAIYRLSPAEADIAVRLFEGKPRTQIADERGVTPETLRGQIKQIYLKCAVDGEAELMRLLAPVLG